MLGDRSVVARRVYCQLGQILAAFASLSKTPKPSDADIDAQITNACLCGIYHRIRGDSPRGRSANLRELTAEAAEDAEEYDLLCVLCALGGDIS